MKLRRLSKSHLLVLGAFLAAGATALRARDPRRRRSRADPLPRRAVLRDRLRRQRSNDDPIVLAKPGASHHHTFIGNKAVDAKSTAASLVGGASSCEDIGDSSAYWVPTLFAGGRAVRPLVGVGYYVRRTSEPVRAFPAGLVMIAGNQNAKRHSRSPWSAGAAAASALRQVGRRAELPAGPGAAPAGDVPELLERPRPRQRRPQASHGLRDERALPAHSVAVPTLVLIFLYPETEQRRLLQASGRYGAHADFMNGWNQDTLEAGGGAQLTRYNARPRGYSSAGRAPGSHPGGRRFEPA